MIAKQLFKKAGVLGVSLGLLASPLVFADMHDYAVDEHGASDPKTTQPEDPAADPMADSGASVNPADEPGFGDGLDPLPNGKGAAQPDEEREWELPDDEESESN